MSDLSPHVSVLREALADPFDSPADFVRLAIAGEELRRRLALLGDANPDAAEALGRYDIVLPSLHALVPRGLEAALEDALGRLTTEPDPLEAILGVDEILEIAAAGHRAGAVPVGRLHELGQRARRGAADASVDAGLATAADQHSLERGPDPDHHELYGWLESIAAHAAARAHAAELAEFFSPTERARVVESVLAIWSARAGDATSVWAELTAILAAWTRAVESWVSVAAPVRIALAAPRAPGETEVGVTPLLVVREGASYALVLSLRARVRAHGESGATLRGDAAMLATARSAIRRGFDVCAVLARDGQPPAPLDEHVVEISGAGADAIDGGSIGLPFALALASAWTGTRGRDGVAATAFVGHGGRLHGVGGVAAKARAWASVGGTTLLVAPGDAAQLVDAPPGLVVIEVSTVEEALAAAGLDLAAASFVPWLGSVHDRVERLRELCQHVATQRLEPYTIGGEDPWLVLGDRIHLLVDSLARERSPDSDVVEIVQQARAMGALALMHGLDVDGAQILVRAAGPTGNPFADTLVRIATLSQLIDKLGPSESPDAERVFAELADVPDGDAARLRGPALGTRGRLRMHQRRLDEAIPLLREAVMEHDRTVRRESARSRIYLAMALRLAGRHVEALATLAEARERLEMHTRAQVPHYAATTETYLAYEVARVLLGMGRPRDALVSAAFADGSARRAGLLWPRPGVLRTAIWARRALGESEGAELAVLEELASRDSFVRAFLDEARGPMREDGLVY